MLQDSMRSWKQRWSGKKPVVKGIVGVSLRERRDCGCNNVTDETDFSLYISRNTLFLKIKK